MVLLRGLVAVASGQLAAYWWGRASRWNGIACTLVGSYLESLMRGKGALIKVAAFLPMVVGCAEPAVPGPPFSAEVLTLSGIDPETEMGQYEVTAKQLTTLTDFGSLDGQYLRLFRGGRTIHRRCNRLRCHGTFLRGETIPCFVMKWRTTSSSQRDYPTLMMLSAYHQFDRVFADLERVTGVSIAALAASWPKFEVFFEPVIRQDDDIDVTATIKFNAFYLPGAKQFGAR